MQMESHNVPFGALKTPPNRGIAHKHAREVYAPIFTRAQISKEICPHDEATVTHEKDSHAGTHRMPGCSSVIRESDLVKPSWMSYGTLQETADALCDS